MKKILLLIVGVVAFSISSNAQVEERAIGVRLGGSNYGGGFEASYQHGLGDANRLEFDLGWSGNNGVSHMKVSGVYQWVFELDGGINWYAGPGAQFVLASASGSSRSAVGVGGQLGAEYNFNTNDVPLIISLDTRPMVHFGDDYFDSFGWGVALGVRYTF